MSEQEKLDTVILRCHDLGRHELAKFLASGMAAAFASWSNEARSGDTGMTEGLSILLAMHIQLHYKRDGWEIALKSILMEISLHTNQIIKDAKACPAQSSSASSTPSAPASGM